MAVKRSKKEMLKNILHPIFSFIRRRCSKSKKDLKYLVKDSQTPKGLNEQGVKELTKAGFYKSLEQTLNSIHKRLSK